MLKKLNVVVAKTAGGQADYIQIKSPEPALLSAPYPVTIVLVAEEITVQDRRHTAGAAQTGGTHGRSG